jgi:hypothetical protein
MIFHVRLMTNREILGSIGWGVLFSSGLIAQGELHSWIRVCYQGCCASFFFLPWAGFFTGSNLFFFHFSFFSAFRDDVSS